MNSEDFGNLFVIFLTIAFIVLKLCGVIVWNWVWVLSPLWIPAGIGVAFMIIFFIIYGVYKLVKR